MNLGKDKREALTVMFSELVENVYRHARSNFGAYVMAQAYPKTDKFHVVVADSGIGVFASFRESDLDSVRRRATNEEAAIDLALERKVTSKTEQHGGLGLFVVQRLVQHNGGQFRLSSGRTTKEFGPARGRWGRVDYNAVFSQHLPWNGTEVSLIFNLDQPMTIQEVYRELGPPDRVEDFFD